MSLPTESRAPPSLADLLRTSFPIGGDPRVALRVWHQGTSAPVLDASHHTPMRNTATSQDIILVPHSNRNPLARLPRAALSVGRKSPPARRLRIPQLSTCISRASIWRNGTLTADGQGIDPRAIPSWVPQLRVIGSRRPMPRPTHLVCSPAPMHVGWPGGRLIGECRWSLGVLRTAALSCLIPSCPPRHSILSAFAQTLGWHEGLYISSLNMTAVIPLRFGLLLHRSLCFLWARSSCPTRCYRYL